MATTQQWATGGGLLAGIGGNNANAPRANDVNATLALIQQNNDLQRSGANNIGLQALQGLAGVAQAYTQGKQQEALSAFNHAHANAWKAGDMSVLRDFAAQNPAFVEQAQKAVAGLDAQQKNELGSLAMGVNTALAQGPEAFSRYVTKNADGLRRIGADPNWMIQAGVQNPEQLSHFASTLALGAVGPEKMFDIQDKAVGRQIDQAKLAEQMRANRASESLQGQQIAVSRENSIRSAYAPTSAMQNFNQYAQMLKSDPEGAAVFAQAAGINTAGKKLMKVEKNDDGSVTKYYTDGTEEAGKLNQPVSGDGFKPISIPQAQTVLEKAPEGAKKSGGFAYRVRQNLDAIDALKVDPKRIALINTALGQGSSLGNLKMSGPEQQYVAYAGDAIAAILRQESGAAIPIEEQQSYYKRYFPQIGDSDTTVKTKRNLLENQFKALRGASGRAYDALNVVSAADVGSQPQQSAITPAPDAALKALQSDPSLAPQFRAKYGYLP